MNKTKEAISSFVSKAGHHDTTVHGSVAPAVQHETVKRTQHEDVNTAVDKEVHQDHYHTTVQPVQDKEVLAEQHSHRVGAVENREYDHRNHDDTKRALASESSKFRDERTVQDGGHTQSMAPTVQGEHVHHHVHETIQPVVHKETIQPNVVHTTVPIHEVHHNAAQHHSATALNPVHMSEFKKSGGVLGGQEERVDTFKGGPENIEGLVSSGRLQKSTHTERDVPGVHHGDVMNEGKGHHTGGLSSTGQSHGQHDHSSTGVGGTHSGVGSSHSGVGSNYSGTNTGVGGTHSGVGGTHSGVGGTHSGVGGNNTGVGGAHAGSTTQPKKSGGLLDKLNPNTDSNGDGKAGFLK